MCGIPDLQVWLRRSMGNPPGHFPLGNGPEAFRAGYNPDTIYLQSYNPINLKPRERFTSSFILLRRTWFCRLMGLGRSRKGAKSKKRASRLHAVRFSFKNKRLACTACVVASQAPLHPHAYYLSAVHFCFPKSFKFKIFTNFY